MKLSIIIPTYEEAENLKLLIPQLIKNFNPYEIIVVDDDSKDGTKELVRLGESYKEVIERNKYKELQNQKTRIRLITRTEERGIGSAIARGYDEATGDVLLSVDADLSMDLNDVPKMLTKLNEGYDVIVGSRYIPGGQNRKEAFLPRMASIVGNWVFKLIFKLPIKDVSMNFRTLKKSTWENIKTKESTNVQLLELLVNANNKGYKVAEVPTVFGDRIHGESKTNIWKLTPIYLKYIFRYLISG